MTHHASHHSPEMQECIRNCLDCAQVCTETIAHCAGQRMGESSIFLPTVAAFVGFVVRGALFVCFDRI